MGLLRQSLVIGYCLLTVPAAPIAQAQDRDDIPGVYSVEGKNFKGEPYLGTVEIVAQDDTFIFHWVLSTSEEAYGVGIVSHGLLVVAAGAPTPRGIMLSNVVAYAWKPGEPMVGEWATPGTPGVYQEVLTKLPVGHLPLDPKRATPDPDRTRQRTL